MPAIIDRAPEGATHELKDLEVYEVSLVDRPANKRKFLAVKADEKMPASQELKEDGSGGLSPATPTAKEFGDSAKKKLKGALAGAAAKLKTLIDSIDSATDEASALKTAAGIGATLSKFGPKEEAADTKDKDKDKSDKAETPPPTPADPGPTQADVQKLADQRAANDTSVATAEVQRKRDERDEKTDKHLATLTKAAHTLTSMAMRQGSGGSRAAPAAKAAGENPGDTKRATPLWKTDMNSGDIPDDEQFA